MRNRMVVLLLILLISLSTLLSVTGYDGRRGEGERRRWWEEEEEGQEQQEEEAEEEEEEEEYGGGGRGRPRRGSDRGLFLLGDAKVVVKTEGGTVRIVKGYKWKGWPSSMHIGFIDMEPNTLLLPQYMDAHLILFIRRGEVKVGNIYKDDFVENNLTMGDIYRISAGSVFYMANTGRGQRVQIICSIDTSEGLGDVPFQSFFIGGGMRPTSVISGFDRYSLSQALNVTEDELTPIMGRQTGGPLIYMTGAGGEGGGDDEQSKKLESVMRLKQKEMQKLKRAYEDDEDEDEEEEAVKEGGVEAKIKESKTWTWSWRKLLNVILGNDGEAEVEKVLRGKENKGTVKAPDAYNLYNREPDFRNTYGWTVAIDKHEYKPLKKSSIGIYLVNLTAGSMLAPHVNPMATEYGVVLSGSGRVEVVFPNGSSAMNVEVGEGDTFFIPRYFPFCQIAARSEPLEFFGFTTSARRNRPQFLIGSNSVLNSMMGPELAAAFGTSEERLRDLFSAQNESIVLPSWPSTEREGREEEGKEGGKEGEEGEEGREEEEPPAQPTVIESVVGRA